VTADPVGDHPADRLPGPEEIGSYDPLRLCVYATVALIAWLTGPLAVIFFAGLGLVGYIRARRAGLTRSKCLLRDTRLVIGYLVLLVAAAAASVIWHLLV
jgi:hypothetical protein